MNGCGIVDFGFGARFLLLLLFDDIRLYCINSSAYAPSTKKMWRQALPERSICTYTTQFDCFPYFMVFRKQPVPRAHQMNWTSNRPKKKRTKGKSPNRRFVFLRIFFLLDIFFFFSSIFRCGFAIVKRKTFSALSLYHWMVHAKREHIKMISLKVYSVCSSNWIEFVTMQQPKEEDSHNVDVAGSQCESFFSVSFYPFFCFTDDLWVQIFF